jgi:hypothetical protein
MKIFFHTRWRQLTLWFICLFLLVGSSSCLVLDRRGHDREFRSNRGHHYGWYKPRAQPRYRQQYRQPRPPRRYDHRDGKGRGR